MGIIQNLKAQLEKGLKQFKEAPVESSASLIEAIGLVSTGFSAGVIRFLPFIGPYFDIFLGVSLLIKFGAFGVEKAVDDKMSYRIHGWDLYLVDEETFNNPNSMATEFANPKTIILCKKQDQYQVKLISKDPKTNEIAEVDPNNIKYLALDPEEKNLKLKEAIKINKLRDKKIINQIQQQCKFLPQEWHGSNKYLAADRWEKREIILGMFAGIALALAVIPIFTPIAMPLGVSLIVASNTCYMMAQYNKLKSELAGEGGTGNARKYAKGLAFASAAAATVGSILSATSVFALFLFPPLAMPLLASAISIYAVSVALKAISMGMFFYTNHLQAHTVTAVDTANTTEDPTLRPQQKFDNKATSAVNEEDKQQLKDPAKPLWQPAMPSKLEIEEAKSKMKPVPKKK